MAQKIFLSILLVYFLGAVVTQAQNKKSDGINHLKIAQELELQNNPDAKEEFRLAIEECEHCSDALYSFGWYLAHNLDFLEASDILEEYYKKNDLEKKSSSLTVIGNLREAARLKTSIEKTDRPSLDELLRYTKIIFSYAKNRTKSALPYAEKAVELYPKSSQAYVTLAKILITNQPQRKLELLIKAIELDPNNFQAHSLLGYSYIYSKPNEAISEFKKALELSNEKQLDAWKGLGYTYEHLGLKNEAIEAYRKYIQANGGIDQEANFRLRLLEEQKPSQ